MFVLREIFRVKDAVKAVNVLNRSRWMHLTAAESSDPFVNRNLEEIVIPDATICEIILPKFETFKKHTAVVCAETGKQFTYQQLGNKTHNFSKSLRKIFKLKKGDKVAILSKNSPDYVLATFGALRAGLAVTTLNPLYTPDEISKQLLDSDAKVVIAQVGLCSNVKKAFSIMKKQLPIVAVKEHATDSFPEGTINFDELINTKMDIPDIDYDKSDGLAFLPYSSGTTGMPKGVELSHRNLVSNLFQAAHPSFNSLKNATDTYQNEIPIALPMYHIYGFTCGLSYGLYFGSKLITLPKFTPNLYVSVLKNNKITNIFAAPPIILFLIDHPDVKPDYFKHVRTITSGAAPLGYTDEIKMREKIGNDNVLISQGYGLTETSPLITMAPKGFRSTKSTGGTIGILVPNTAAKIISEDDDTGNALCPGKTGELLVKGPQVMKKYHNRPEETLKSFKDGWFRTGDIGHYNEDGFFFITDRLKELIKVKGFQVPPAELEAVIRSHPEVGDVGVIGIPHAAYGEVPRAYVVPKNKNSFNIKHLQEYVTSKVAKYKQLAGGVQLTECIPRNPSGKILRRELKQQFLEKGI